MVADNGILPLLLNTSSEPVAATFTIPGPAIVFPPASSFTSLSIFTVPAPTGADMVKPSTITLSIMVVSLAELNNRPPVVLFTFRDSNPTWCLRQCFFSPTHTRLSHRPWCRRAVPGVQLVSCIETRRLVYCGGIRPPWLSFAGVWAYGANCSIPIGAAACRAILSTEASRVCYLSRIHTSQGECRGRPWTTWHTLLNWLTVIQAG